MFTEENTLPKGTDNAQNQPVEDSAVLDSYAVAKLVGTHVETVRRLARKGLIPAFKLGKDWRFSKKSLLRWVDNNYTKKHTPLILIVDDEENILFTTRLCLENYGYRVRTAANGKDAIETAQQKMPDLVLLDLVMSDMHGADVLKHLRNMNPELSVIIVTAYPNSELMEKALRYPPVTLLPKPVESNILLKTIKQTLLGVGIEL